MTPFAAAPAAGQEKASPRRARQLFLLGGAPKPHELWEAFTKAVKPGTRVVILPWASSDPEGTLARIREETQDLVPATFWEVAPPAPLDSAAKRKVLDQLRGADGIFVLGGDQNKFLDAVQDLEIRSTIKTRYDAGAFCTIVTFN